MATTKEAVKAKDAPKSNFLDQAFKEPAVEVRRTAQPGMTFEVVEGTEEFRAKEPATQHFQPAKDEDYKVETVEQSSVQEGVAPISMVVKSIPPVDPSSVAEEVQARKNEDSI